MRSANVRLAGIAAMACGALASTGAVAMQDGPPAATGECAAQANGDAPALTSDDAQDERDWPAGGALALSDARLDAMRGGFDMPDGLKVSFGVSRVAFVNGNLVASTSFNIPDVSRITAQQAQALAAANAGALLQVGPGNAAQPGALPALTGAVIQNTLNNQHLQTLTTINTTVNTLSSFKNLNVMSTIGNALTGALPGR
ncbi:hypothetical protein [Burkholderia sp. Bp9143]|uniref:hypothetical protein n=1 Tax=Burkholderia sp. Bp9143 TaxID=2184574 RepID=UPI000F5A1203|nr:hypothetical protein [Burkholderia sp. Bp9143]